MDYLNSYEIRRHNLWFSIFCVECNGSVLECLTINHANLGSNVVLLFWPLGMFVHSTLLQFTQLFKRVHGYRQWWKSVQRIFCALISARLNVFHSQKCVQLKRFAVKCVIHSQELNTTIDRQTFSQISVCYRVWPAIVKQQMSNVLPVFQPITEYVRGRPSLTWTKDVSHSGVKQELVVLGRDDASTHHQDVPATWNNTLYSTVQVAQG